MAGPGCGAECVVGTGGGAVSGAVVVAGSEADSMGHAVHNTSI